jgi:hypothetical protein
LYVAKALGRNRVVRFDSAEFRAHFEDDDEHAESGSSAARARQRG